MSTIGGSSAGNGFTVSAEGTVRFGDGVEADLTTAAGVAQAEDVLDEGQIAELRALMQAQGFKLEDGCFVPDDSYGALGTSSTGGPSSTTDGMTELDALLGQAFSAAGVPPPFNANTTPLLGARLRGSAQFEAATKATSELFANPTPENHKAFFDAMQKLTGAAGGVNVMELLYLVFRESIKEVNEDKKYFLRQLQDFNKMAGELSTYLSTLVDKSMELSEKSRGKEEPHKQTVEVEVRTFDTGTLDPTGHMQSEVSTRTERVKSGPPGHRIYEDQTFQTRVLDRTGLTDVIKQVENQQEEVRNKRQMATTAFQNFDQKSNQLMNMISSLIKTMNEMRSVGPASRSGL